MSHIMKEVPGMKTMQVFNLYNLDTRHSHPKYICTNKFCIKCLFWICWKTRITKVLAFILSNANYFDFVNSMYFGRHLDNIQTRQITSTLVLINRM